MFANQGLRGAGAELCGYGPAAASPRRYKQVDHPLHGASKERVINKVSGNRHVSPRRNRPYGASPGAAAIRPPTSKGFAASVSPTLGSPKRPAAPEVAPAMVSPTLPNIQDRALTPMPEAAPATRTYADAAADGPRLKTAGFSPRGYHQAQAYHQSVSAPAFARKGGCNGPRAAIGTLADFGNGAEPGKSPASKKVNINGTAGNSCSNRHRNTMGGVTQGGAGYLHRGQRRRIVQDQWNSSTESQPHAPGMHAKSHHPLSPRRLGAISPRAANDINTRSNAMAAIMGHAHVQ